MAWMRFFFFCLKSHIVPTCDLYINSNGGSRFFLVNLLSRREIRRGFALIRIRHFKPTMSGWTSPRRASPRKARARGGVVGDNSPAPSSPRSPRSPRRTSTTESVSRSDSPAQQQQTVVLDEILDPDWEPSEAEVWRFAVNSLGMAPDANDLDRQLLWIARRRSRRRCPRTGSSASSARRPPMRCRATTSISRRVSWNDDQR